MVLRKLKRRPRVFFDIETVPFSEDFRRAKTRRDRIRLAPKMRVAVVYDEKAYRVFYPGQEAALLALLNSAREVISFNGWNFDELVLRKHCGLKGPFPINGLHRDLLANVELMKGYRVSLNQLAMLNLNEPKYLSGLDIADADVATAATACRSDVRQTRLLWLKWKKFQLQIPDWPTYRRHAQSTKLDMCIGPGHHSPKQCPNCKTDGSLFSS